MPAAKADRKSSSSAKKKAKDGKDKPRRSKDKPSSSSSSKAPPSGAEPSARLPPSAPAPAVAADPDAVQLFRRYDRSRAGFLARADFLQLVRDYAAAVAPDGRSASRAPLSLTDSRGVPLGYARADRNSEFEAGQLFERYDADRSGALTLDEFLRFFADFQPQLAAFVQDAAYAGLPVAPHAQSAAAMKATSEPQPPPTPEQQPRAEAASAGAEREPSIKRQYQKALWEMHKLCKEELEGQRERIVLKMAALRTEAERRQQRARAENHGAAKQTVRFTHIPPGRRSAALNSDSDGDDVDSRQGFDLVETLYETLETDLDHIDEITRFFRRFHRRGSDVTLHEMHKFLARAPVAQEEAQHLAMKDYGDRDWRRRPTRSAPPSRSLSPPGSPSVARAGTPLAPSHSSKNAASLSRNQQDADDEEDAQRPHPQESRRQRDLEELLRVKDQMIYQLLQERAAMRKDKSAMEAHLKTLSRVSSHEMKKWAQLTDEMQGEIERLRARLAPGRRSAPFQ